MAVVVFHFMEWVYPNPSKIFIGHGFLAVDFFFCLSGFVIGYAYDNRIKILGLKEFFKSRLIRLHPLVILGSAIITNSLDPGAGAAKRQNAPITRAAEWRNATTSTNALADAQGRSEQVGPHQSELSEFGVQPDRGEGSLNIPGDLVAGAIVANIDGRRLDLSIGVRHRAGRLSTE